MEFTTPQVAKLSGASYRQLDNWDREGLLTPSSRRANGSGSRRSYALSDVLTAAVLADLSAAGVRYRTLAGVVRLLDRPHRDWPDTLTVADDGRALTGPPARRGAYVTFSPTAYVADLLPTVHLTEVS